MASDKWQRKWNVASRKWQVFVLLVTCHLSLGTLLSLASLPAAEPIERWGLPEGTVHKSGPLRYAMDPATGEASWVLEYLTLDTISGTGADVAPRPGAFHADDTIPAEYRVRSSDFAKSGFDIGHLAPNADFGSAGDRAATFLLSNTTPQQPTLNRGLWRHLEDRTRQELDGASAELWVVTCPLWIASADELKVRVIGRHRVSVPTHYAKCVLPLHQHEHAPARLVAWIVPNAEPTAGATEELFRVPTRDVETAARLNFWPDLEAKLQEELETAK